MEWKESNHPRDREGKFTSTGFGAIIPGYDKPVPDNALHREEFLKMSTDVLKEYCIRQSMLYDTIPLPDEDIPKSVGAKWINHKIDLPDGSIARFVEGSKLQNKEIFAGKGCRRKIDDIERLVKEHPGSKATEWAKVKANAEIELPNGERVEAEVHWYEEPGVGKIEFKVKDEVL